MVSEEGTAATPPYVSFQTFINLLDRLANGGIPQHIDRHYWGSFLAGGVGQQIMVALRFLGLIDSESNEPTPILEQLVAPDHRKSTLAKLLRERYTAVWDSNVDPARTTPGHLEAAFTKLYKVDGETRRKAVTFFVHAAKFAELPLSAQIAAKSRQRRPSSSSSNRTRSKSGRGGDTMPPPAGTRERPRTTEESPFVPDDGPYAILHTWLRQLPAERRWTTERRQLWLRALEANVDFLIAVEGEDEEDAYAYDYEDDEGGMPE